MIDISILGMRGCKADNDDLHGPTSPSVSRQNCEAVGRQHTDSQWRC